jgi:ketosteroid isomerase-like protein
MTPSDVVHEMFARYQAADFDALAGLIHPDAVWNTHVAHGRELHGRDEVVRVLQTLPTSVYQMSTWSIEDLDAAFALGTGAVRYPLEHGGFAQSTGAWLWEARDGMVITATAFASPVEAVAAWREADSARDLAR